MTTMNNNATLVNILGAARSGTTMLDLMLGNSDDAFSCGEVYAWFRPYRTHHFNIICSCGENPCPVWKVLKDVPEKFFHKSVIEKMSVKYVIDSSKNLRWVIDSIKWARKNNIKIYNIVIWKDPVQLSYSHWKRGKTNNVWRKNFVGYYSKFLRLEIPFVSVRYSELVQSPSKKLKELCNFIGMDYFPGKENFWQKKHHHLFGSLGVRKQIESGNSRIESDIKYPEEFNVLINSIKQNIEKDTVVKKIITKLNEMEVSKIDPRDFDVNKYDLKLLYPLWYYYDIIKALFRRRFPQKWDSIQ